MRHSREDRRRLMPYIVFKYRAQENAPDTNALCTVVLFLQWAVVRTVYHQHFKAGSRHAQSRISSDILGYFVSIFFLKVLQTHREVSQCRVSVCARSHQKFYILLFSPDNSLLLRVVISFIWGIKLFLRLSTATVQPRLQENNLIENLSVRSESNQLQQQAGVYRVWLSQ